MKKIYELEGNHIWLITNKIIQFHVIKFCFKNKINQRINMVYLLILNIDDWFIEMK